MQDGTVELSIISPMYNEELVIRDAVSRLLRAASALTVTWEVILVNDGSTDGTQAIIEELAAQDPRVRIVAYERNRGRGYALRSGYRASCGHYVVATEADMTWGEDIIQRLYDELIDSGADIVIASPYRKGGRLENVPFKRALLSWLGNRILRFTVPLNITMLTGMTRGYKGDIIRSMHLEEDRKEVHLEIVSKGLMLGYSFSEVPAVLRWEPPVKGKKKRKSSFQAGRLIRSHLSFGLNEAPILLFGSIGLLLLAVGAASGLYLSYLFFILGNVIGDRFILITTTVFLILSGLQIFIFCFLAYQNKGLKADLFKMYSQIDKDIKNVKGQESEDVTR